MKLHYIASAWIRRVLFSLVSAVCVAGSASAASFDFGPIDVADFLYRQSGLDFKENSPHRCGGPCTSKPCALRPRCDWVNELQNVRISDFSENEFSEVDEEDILQRRGFEKNVVRINCDENDPEPAKEFRQKNSITHTVELEHKERFKSVKSQKFAIDISAQIYVVDVKAGGEIFAETEYEITSTSKQVKAHSFEEDVTFSWKEIPPSTKHWIQKYKIVKKVRIPFKGDIVFDADWVRSSRQINSDGTLGAIWAGPEGKGALSATRLPRSQDRTINAEFFLIPEGAAETYVERYSAAPVTEEDCSGDWPHEQLQFADGEIYTTSNWETISSTEPRGYEVLAKKVWGNLANFGENGEGRLNTPEVCESEEKVSEQDGDALDVLFDVIVESCPNDHHGVVSFNVVARDSEDGSLNIRDASRTWNYEDEDEFEVEFYDGNHFHDSEELLRIEDIETECYCY